MNAEHSRIARRLTAVLPSDAATIAASRVSTLPLLQLLSPRRIVSLPVVWGRTLWNLAEDALCLVEQPNGLGCLEVHEVPIDAVVVKTMPGVPDPPGGRRPIVDLCSARPDRSHEVNLARRLRGRLSQITGAQPVIRRLESARFAMLFPGGVAELAALPAPDGVRVAPLAEELAEYPGGVRFEVRPGAVESEVIAYAEAVADRLA